jgi:hypothetical protein
MVGYPTVAAGDSGSPDGNTSGDEAITKEELERSLAEMDLHLASPSTGTQSNTVDEPSELVDDAKIYVGENKNANTPTGKPYVVESFEEFKNREVPAGFSSADSPNSFGTSTDGVTTSDLSTYVKRTTKLNFDGIPKFESGVGLGIKFSSSGAGFLANITVDLYIGTITLTVSSFGIGVGVTDKGVCLKDWSTKYYGVKITGGVCLNATLTNSELSVGLSADVCGDPCPTKGFNCPFCKGVSFNPVSVDVPDVL